MFKRSFLLILGFNIYMINANNLMQVQAHVRAIILAAGRSTRFHTSETKLSYPICGKEMIMHPITLLRDLGIETTLVLGHQKDLLLDIIKKYDLDNAVNHVVQDSPKGTGHAILCSKPMWDADNLLVLNGDMPLVNKNTIEELIETHQNNNAAISLVVTYNDSSVTAGYGRLVTINNITAIVEAKDFKRSVNDDPFKYNCLNAGIYLINREFLESVNLEPSPVTGEIYITDLVKIASERNLPVNTVEADFDTVRGINTLQELFDAEKIKNNEIISYWMSQGVYFEAPETVKISADAIIGQDTKISPCVQLLEKVTVGKNCFVGPFCIVKNSAIDHNSIIKSHSVITNSSLSNSVEVGPFAHIQNSSMGEKSIVGNFVEANRSSIGASTKAKHLAYLGDAEVGSDVNMGAGTITCNYNGVTKNKTIIESGAFIGSNSSLIAPVIVGEGALVAAGSVITKDVPKDALAISRPDQITKEEYVPKLRAKYRNKK